MQFSLCAVMLQLISNVISFPFVFLFPLQWVKRYESNQPYQGTPKSSHEIQTHSKPYTVHTSTVCENKYQLSIFICEMKCNKNKNESPSSGNACQPTLSVLCTQTVTIHQTSIQFIFFFYRLKGLRHWFSNAIRFNSIRKKKMKFHFANGKNQQWNSTPRSGEKMCDGKADKTTIDKSIDRTTSIIIIKAKKLCFTGVKHSFPLKPCNLYRALESAHECICLNRSEYVLKQRHIVSFCESHCTHARTQTHRQHFTCACMYFSFNRKHHIFRHNLFENG